MYRNSLLPSALITRDELYAAVYRSLATVTAMLPPSRYAARPCRPPLPHSLATLPCRPPLPPSLAASRQALITPDELYAAVYRSLATVTDMLPPAMPPSLAALPCHPILPPSLAASRQALITPDELYAAVYRCLATVYRSLHVATVCRSRGGQESGWVAGWLAGSLASYV